MSSDDTSVFALDQSNQITVVMNQKRQIYVAQPCIKNLFCVRRLRRPRSLATFMDYLTQCMSIHLPGLISLLRIACRE